MGACDGGRAACGRGGAGVVGVPQVEIDGLVWNVDRSGQGPPVVLLHGFTGSRNTWYDLRRVLDGEFTTLAVDLIGHGASGSPASVERYEMRRAVDDLAALLTAMGFERAAWLGYSLGGRVALQVTVHQPEVVSALILEGASPGIATDEGRQERREADERLARMIEQEGLEPFVDYWEALPLWASQAETLSDAQRESLRRQRLGQRGVGLANSLRGMGTGAQEWLGDRLGEIDVPVLLTAGSLDARYAEIAQTMAQAMPDARVQLIEGGGHAAHLERPEAFNDTVLAFLREVRERL